LTQVKARIIQISGFSNGKPSNQQKIVENSMIQELKNEFEQTQVSSDEGTPLGKKGHTSSIQPFIR